MDNSLKKTVFYEKHLELNATMVNFSGWDMPVQYPGGIVHEHLATRKQAGVFDVSHMGRFIVSGEGALFFLQHVLSNNVAALDIGESQYTMIPTYSGGVIDDAYLYRFFGDRYLLVVNAANREKDWHHLNQALQHFGKAKMVDQTDEIAMISLQGPAARNILSGLLQEGRLPEPMRNKLSTGTINGVQVLIARTGYTGEPLCFELFINREDAPEIWDLLLQRGGTPIGLGARDTLRLEAGLPLYGHELGPDPENENKELPMFAFPLARLAVSFSSLKGAFIGKSVLLRQFTALKKIGARNYEDLDVLPKTIMTVAVTGKGVARAGCKVFVEGRSVGVVTSGTMVPYWNLRGEGVHATLSDNKAMRSIGLALLDSRLSLGDRVGIEIRNRRVDGVIVPYFLRSEAPPYARAILADGHQRPASKVESAPVGDYLTKAKTLIAKSIDNTRWRTTECINLIPSEQAPSIIARMLSIMDPVCRYAEHKHVKALNDADVFYYQGGEFIAEVETLLAAELRIYLGCREVETRLISGQMANAAVFSALTEYINRFDRRPEPRRLRRVMNNHIIKGGHLSAQPMGALKDFVARDPQTEKPAVTNFPVMEDNPFRIDVAACEQMIEQFRPELIILGKSVVLHPEPVKLIRDCVDSLGLDTIVMYDMAHVLGLVGDHFQDPFKEGAHVVTGSTHKTYFGTQRGIVATDYAECDQHYEFWEAIERRTFPGSTSNHHLGSQLGLLMAAYEMNAFKSDYQQAVITNAKALARALHNCGLHVAGDSAIGFTETHQVVLDVGYAQGPEMARRLEANHIIVNYQAGPQEEGFTASGSLRLGVSEMTRFGMTSDDCDELAQLIYDVIVKHKTVRDAVIKFRSRFREMKFCFSDNQLKSCSGEILELLNGH